MSIPRLKCKNDKKKVTMLIFIPFVDHSVEMDKAARNLFDTYVERSEKSFFIDVLGHCFCDDGIILFVDFLCPLDVTIEEIKERQSNWKKYAPWLRKEIDEYIEKNAFSSSFIIANMSQCFSKNLNLMKNRSRKLSGVFISTILDDNKRIITNDCTTRAVFSNRAKN